MWNVADVDSIRYEKKKYTKKKASKDEFVLSLDENRREKIERG